MSNKTYMEELQKSDVYRIVALMAFAGTLIVYVETMIVPAIPVFITFSIPPIIMFPGFSQLI